MLWRFMPSDFNYRTHYIERYGKDKLPEGNRIQDWPVSYHELEPYFDAFEYDVGASGQAGNLNGNIIEGGNPFEGPRSRPYPLPPLVRTIPSEMFAKASTELGYHPFPQPAGILSQAYKDPLGNQRSGCLYCGYCTRFGCEVDAKSSAQTTHLPPALATGRYEIRPNSYVTKINTGADGLATGVTYLDENEQEQEQPADVVIASAYTPGNVRSLLLSRSDKHPNGVGNDRGLVGQNYTYQHWHTIATGIFPGRKFNLWMGNTSTQNVIFDFNGDNFDHSNVDFVGGAMIFATLGERDPLTSAQDYPYGNGKTWGTDFKTALRDHWNSTADILMQGESLPYDDQFYDLDPTYKDKYGLPLLRLTFDWHKNDYAMYKFIAQKGQEIMKQMNPSGPTKYTLKLDPYNIHKYQSTHLTGGAIMGTDAGNSVTNSYGQVWDTPNVFVTGACLYPQNPGMNPTGALCALAYRTGDAMVERYFKHPNKIMG